METSSCFIYRETTVCNVIPLLRLHFGIREKWGGYDYSSLEIRIIIKPNMVNIIGPTSVRYLLGTAGVVLIKWAVSPQEDCRAISKIRRLQIIITQNSISPVKASRALWGCKGKIT